MSTGYISYKAFATEVRSKVDKIHYSSCNSFLPFVNIDCRERFLRTLNICRNIITASELLLLGKKLPEKHYYRYIKFCLAEGGGTEFKC